MQPYTNAISHSDYDKSIRYKFDNILVADTKLLLGQNNTLNSWKQPQILIFNNKLNKCQATPNVPCTSCCLQIEEPDFRRRFGSFATKDLSNNLHECLAKCSDRRAINIELAANTQLNGKLAILALTKIGNLFNELNLTSRQKETIALTSKFRCYIKNTWPYQRFEPNISSLEAQNDDQFYTNKTRSDDRNIKQIFYSRFASNQQPNLQIHSLDLHWDLKKRREIVYLSIKALTAATTKTTISTQTSEIVDKPTTNKRVAKQQQHHHHQRELVTKETLLVYEIECYLSGEEDGENLASSSTSSTGIIKSSTPVGKVYLLALINKQEQQDSSTSATKSTNNSSSSSTSAHKNLESSSTSRSDQLTGNKNKSTSSATPTKGVGETSFKVETSALPKPTSAIHITTANVTTTTADINQLENHHDNSVERNGLASFSITPNRRAIVINEPPFLPTESKPINQLSDQELVSSTSFHQPSINISPLNGMHKVLNQAASQQQHDLVGRQFVEFKSSISGNISNTGKNDNNSQQSVRVGPTYLTDFENSIRMKLRTNSLFMLTFASSFVILTYTLCLLVYLKSKSKLNNQNNKSPALSRHDGNYHQKHFLTQQQHQLHKDTNALAFPNTVVPPSAFGNNISEPFNLQMSEETRLRLESMLCNSSITPSSAIAGADVGSGHNSQTQLALTLPVPTTSQQLLHPFSGRQDNNNNSSHHHHHHFPPAQFGTAGYEAISGNGVEVSGWYSSSRRNKGKRRIRTARQLISTPTRTSNTKNLLNSNLNSEELEDEEFFCCFNPEINIHSARDSYHLPKTKNELNYYDSGCGLSHGRSNSPHSSYGVVRAICHAATIARTKLRNARYRPNLNVIPESDLEYLQSSSGSELKSDTVCHSSFSLFPQGQNSKSMKRKAASLTEQKHIESIVQQAANPNCSHTYIKKSASDQFYFSNNKQKKHFVAPTSSKNKKHQSHLQETLFSRPFVAPFVGDNNQKVVYGKEDDPISRSRILRQVQKDDLYESGSYCYDTKI